MAVSDEINVWSRCMSIGWQWTWIAFFLQMVYFIVRVCAPADVETLADLINALGAYSLRKLSFGLDFLCLASLFVGGIAAFVVVLRLMFVEFFGVQPHAAATDSPDIAHAPTADYSSRLTKRDATGKRVYSGTPDQLAAVGLRPLPQNNGNSKRGTQR